MKTKTSQYTVFVDPDPHADHRKADWTYTVQAINADATAGSMSTVMERDEAIALYHRTVVARDPLAYLSEVSRAQWEKERAAGYPGWPADEE